MTSLERYKKLNKDSIKLKTSAFSNNEYIFHPRKSLFRNKDKIYSSRSSENIFNFKQNNFNSFFNDIPNENIDKFNLNENMFYTKKSFPPIYFYRKVESPYKYNITSMPEYLLKINQEKDFMEKLETNMKNDNDKKILNELIKNKEKNIKIKDRYKPKALDLQNILKYRPNFYLETLKLKKANINNNNNNKITDINKDKDKDKENKEEMNKEEKKENNDKNNEKEYKEMSTEDQIKYKYQISDIYNKRNEKVITDKSAEKYLFKNQNNNNENTFFTTNRSKSDWVPNRDYGIKMNSFSSVGYNILAPLCKGLFNKFITPTELNKNNLYNESPAYHKVKSLSDFIDLRRVWSRNNLYTFNKEKMKKPPNFKFRGNIATDHLNAFHINRDLMPDAI